MIDYLGGTFSVKAKVISVDLSGKMNILPYMDLFFAMVDYLCSEITKVSMNDGIYIRSARIRNVIKCHPL